MFFPSDEGVAVVSIKEQKGKGLPQGKRRGAHPSELSDARPVIGKRLKLFDPAFLFERGPAPRVEPLPNDDWPKASSRVTEGFSTPAESRCIKNLSEAFERLSTDEKKSSDKKTRRSVHGDVHHKTQPLPQARRRSDTFNICLDSSSSSRLLTSYLRADSEAPLSASSSFSDFSLRTDCRGKEKQAKLKVTVQSYSEIAAKLREFRAKPMPKFYDKLKDVKIEKPEKQSTANNSMMHMPMGSVAASRKTLKAPILSTSLRAFERATFDQQIAEKQAVYKRDREEEEARRTQEEKETTREYRKALTFKAKPFKSSSNLHTIQPN
eukprot:TRINITY_DN13894_c0_g1_i1.p1 TRINITY_DN13894_c0_g1~~TRINITY_DN13894_c0_g1_i1.p1  ORF type:complete len:323 (+),score=55.52 TRINITY_DN13894_c0_g1_i1:41-1009(+)